MLLGSLVGLVSVLLFPLALAQRINIAAKDVERAKQRIRARALAAGQQLARVVSNRAPIEEASAKLAEAALDSQEVRERQEFPRPTRIAPRGTRWSDAETALSTEMTKIERGSDEGLTSAYAERFYQGATILPRVLLTVVELPAGPLGAPKGTRHIQSLRSAQEKEPWKTLDSLEGIVEDQFVHPAYLGVGIAPFRALAAIRAVIPWSKDRLLEGNDAEIDEYPNLASWWRQAERLWEKYKGDKNTLTLKERLDYHGELSKQFPIQPERVVYTKSGNRISACRLSDPQAVIDRLVYGKRSGGYAYRCTGHGPRPTGTGSERPRTSVQGGRMDPCWF